MTFVRRRIHFFVAGLLGLMLLVLLPELFMRFATDAYVYADPDDAPSAQVAIVLGASVVNGTPSPILAARADTAIALFQNGKVPKILVTGDNASTTYDEVNPVQKYLTDANIPATDIFLDHAGFDTYSSMYRAVAVFDARSAIVVTQDFHMPRALFLARHLGLQAYGVEAEGGQGSVFDYVREIPASWKALLDLFVHRQPEYLGQPYPLTSSGTSTWY